MRDIVYAITTFVASEGECMLFQVSGNPESRIFLPVIQEENLPRSEILQYLSWKLEETIAISGKFNFTLSISGIPVGLREIFYRNPWMTKIFKENAGFVTRHIWTDFSFQYCGWSKSCLVVTWFWSVVSGLREEEKSLLLKFSTGSTCVPAGGFSKLLVSVVPRPHTFIW